MISVYPRLPKTVKQIALVQPDAPGRRDEDSRQTLPTKFVQRKPSEQGKFCRVLKEYQRLLSAHPRDYHRIYVQTTPQKSCLPFKLSEFLPSLQHQT